MSTRIIVRHGHLFRADEDRTVCQDEYLTIQTCLITGHTALLQLESCKASVP
jgi:hypothetical protein